MSDPISDIKRGFAQVDEIDKMRREEAMKNKGKLKKCGCFDGPYSSATPGILVSVRCQQHLDVPPMLGYSLMERHQDGSVHSLKPRDVTKKRQPTRPRDRPPEAD